MPWWTTAYILKSRVLIGTTAQFKKKKFLGSCSLIGTTAYYLKKLGIPYRHDRG